MAATEDQRCFSSTTPHFFAIILRETLLTNKLKIPNKMVRKCGSSLGDNVLLKLSCGSEWKLGLTRTGEGTVFIDNGWLEFSKHYSIGPGYLLNLQYDGDSRFYVVIFDTTTAKIDYPLKIQNYRETRNCGKRLKEKEKELSDQPALPCSRPRKRTRKCPVTGKFCNLEGEGASSQRSEGLTSPTRSSKVKRKAPKKRTSLQHKSEPVLTAKMKASGFDWRSHSKNPSFAVYMNAVYIKNPHGLRIPADFARTYMNKDQRDIRFYVLDGRSWSVEYRVVKSCGVTRFQICYGWKEFKLDNGLEECDICNFKLTNKDDIAFEVRIFKPAHEGYERMRKLALWSTRTKPFQVPKHSTAGTSTSSSVKSGEVKSEAANESCSEIPHFRVDFPSSHSNKTHLRLPVSFGRRYLEKKTQTVTLQVGEKSWPVKLHFSDPATYRFRAGWAAFRKEIPFHARDVCIFELIKMNEVVFKVSIFAESC